MFSTANQYLDLVMLGNGSIFTTDHRFGQTNIDDRLHNRFMRRHFETFLTWMVGRGSDIGHHFVRDIDKNMSDVDIVL